MLKKGVIKRPRKWTGVPTSDTLPERIFKNQVVEFLVVKYGWGKGRYVTNKAFKTKFTYYPFYPDLRFLDIPLICEVDGIKWHYQKGKKKIEKDKAKNECYVGEGFYVFRVTDKALYKDVENIISDLDGYIGMILNEQCRKPRVRYYPDQP